jgi:hypothetical protein
MAGPITCEGRAMPETRHGIPPEFLDAADEFVQLANRMTDASSREWVAAAMMYATARFNAFAWLTRESNPGQTLDQAAAYYAGEFDKMLRDNVDELAPHYRAAGPSDVQ